MDKRQAWYQGWPVFVEKGGPGSGHHGHAGRPGQRGGSAPGIGGIGGSHPPKAYMSSFNALKLKGKEQASGLMKRTGRKDYTEHNIKVLEDGLEHRGKGIKRLVKSLKNTEAAMKGKQNFEWVQSGGSKKNLRTASEFLKKRIERETKSYWEDAGYIAGGKSALQETD